jgi:putative transposase
VLLAGHDGRAVIADKRFDGDPLVEAIYGKGAEVVIPSRKNRKLPRDYEKHWYKERNK